MQMQANASPSFLPGWAKMLISMYESGACNQFILHGNIGDRFVLPTKPHYTIGNLSDFLQQVLMPRFDIVISYDLGNGLRIDRGGKLISEWPRFKETMELPKAPRPAMEFISGLFRYAANLVALGRDKWHIGCIVRFADLVAPSIHGANHDLGALALLMREWATESAFTCLPLATFIICENLSDIHGAVSANLRATQASIPMPTEAELKCVISVLAAENPMALNGSESGLDINSLAGQLAGSSLSSFEMLVKRHEYEKSPITPSHLATARKQMVERDSNGLVDFVESGKTLDDLEGHTKVKDWLRQDVALWQRGDIEALPKGYLICGPVGTGKTFLVECLAGEAGVPIVKLKNFRDKWVGSTEGNLERIFRLIRALGRCYVFVDEADQALGKRESGTGDSGLSGRVYSMIAEEMGRSDSRGRVIWVLASSRPDLIEVDLKRPGRLDVKIPLFPTLSALESFHLIRNLLKRRNIILAQEVSDELLSMMPTLLTPGAAEVISVKTYRQIKSSASPMTGEAALAAILKDYKYPVPRDILAAQVELAIREASDMDFIPEKIHSLLKEL